MPNPNPCGDDTTAQAMAYALASRCVGQFSQHDLLGGILQSIIDGNVAALAHKDYEPVVLCDVATGNPVILTYTFDDSGVLTTTLTNPDGTPFVGTVGRCPDKDYELSQLAFFCDNNVRTVVRRDLFLNNVLTGTVWTDLAGSAITAPDPLTLTAGECTSGSEVLGAVKITDGTDTANVTGTSLDVNITNSVAPAAPSSLGDGRKIVTVAGTPEALAGSTACTSVTITAELDNTGIIVVGGSTVVATLATRTGAPLAAGDSVTQPIDNLDKVYLNSTVSGDGVNYIFS